MTGVATTDRAGLEAFNRGLAAQQRGEVQEAIAGYRAALKAAPELAAAHFNLGQLLREQGAFAEAAVHFESAARLRPTAADAWLNLGVCRERLGDLETAATCYAEAIQLDPRAATAHFNLGNVKKKQGDLIGALHSFHQAAQLVPQSPEIELNIGTTLREVGQLGAACLALERAAGLRPDWPEPRMNLAVTRLALGELGRGWDDYESRWAQIGLSPERRYPWPAWGGEPLAGRTILVWREQGLGDEILFATCVPDLVAAGAKVTLTADPRLVGLLTRAFPTVTVVADHPPANATFDYHVPIGGLPRWLRRRRSDFAPTWSALVPERTQILRWRERVAALPSGLRVGVCWRSGVMTADRRRFYGALSEWQPLFAEPGVVWVNLQYDDCESELLAAEAAFGIQIHRWPTVDLRDDLESVAALVWHLDLVITAPTAISSIAGAIGTDTWELDPGVDWTALGEDRSPWLPSIRLARRPPGTLAWDAVMQTIRADLRHRTGLDDHR